MPMELRKRKAPAAAPAPPPAPKRKASAKKKEEPKPAAAEPVATTAAAAAATVAEVKAPAAKKAAAPKKAAKAADKAEVTTEAPAPAPAPEPVAPEASKPKPKPKEKKEVKAPKAEVEKEEKPKPAAATAKPVEKKTESKPKDKKPAAATSTAKASTSKSATTTPAPTAATELKAGDAIPSDLPELSNQAGEKVTLPDLLAASKTGIVIFAYPKASTPGCTKQVKSANSSKDNFEAEGYSIYGLSGDKPESNAKFKEAQKLNYPLLSDTTYGLIQKLGIASAAGNGTARSTIIITKDGKIKGIKKAGPEETVKFARTTCGLTADDSKKGETSASAATASKQPTVEEAPDVSA